MQDRRRQLEAEFSRKVVLTEPLEYNHFVALMDAKVRGTFDRDLAKQLWDRAQQHQSGSTSMLQLISVIFEAQDILNTRMDTNKQSLLRYKEERAKSQIQNHYFRAASLDQLREQEKQNAHGVMEGSTVTIMVREAQVDGAEGNYKVLVIVGETKKQTTSKQADQQHKDHLKWEEQVDFSIETGTELITVLLQHNKNKDELTRQLVIPIHTLKDQLAHEGWFDLYDGNGNPSNRISLRLQWVHSKVKYLIGVVRKWDDHIKMANDDQGDYQEHLDQLQLVFQAQQTKLRIDQDKQLLEQKPRVVTGGFVVGALANSIFRVQFIDLLIMSAMFVVLMNSHVDKQQLVVVLLGLVVSQVYELALMSLQVQHLGRQPDLMSRVEGGWVGVVSLIISLGMFIYKWVALAVFGQYYQTFSSQYESLYAYQQ